MAAVHPFDSFGPAHPRSPVVIAVPHAGRVYDPDWAPLLRLGAAQLRPLEDRCVDALLAPSLWATHHAVVARVPRVWIDLNRDPDDLDPLLFRHASGRPVSAKARAGLGIVPRVAGGVPDIWRIRPDAAALADRVARVHTPYHAAIAARLAAARARFGAALLIDLHSMPPVRAPSPPHIVIGDRYGASAPPPIAAALCALVAARGYRVTMNQPYAGGYTLDRHADPARAIYAVQIEVDRSLYLNSQLAALGPGVRAMQVLLAQILAAMHAQLMPDMSQNLAAE